MIMIAPVMAMTTTLLSMLPPVSLSTFAALMKTPEPMTMPTTMDMAVSRPYRFSILFSNAIFLFAGARSGRTARLLFCLRDGISPG